MRAHHHSLVDAFAYFAMHAAAALAIPVSRPAYLPTQRRLWTVPKGPFVHKKAQENFERRVHKRVIKAWDADGDVVRRWVSFLEEHSMPGVGIRVVQWERLPVGFAAKALVNKDKKLLVSGDRIKKLGQKIVQAELEAPKTSEAPAPESVQT